MCKQFKKHMVTLKKDLEGEVNVAWVSYSSEYIKETYNVTYYPTVFFVEG